MHNSTLYSQPPRARNILINIIFACACVYMRALLFIILYIRLLLSPFGGGKIIVKIFRKTVDIPPPPCYNNTRKHKAADNVLDEIEAEIEAEIAEIRGKTAT